MNNHIIITFPSTEDAIAFFEKVKALGLQKSKYGNIPDALVTGFSDFDFGVYRDGKEVHMGAY